MITTNRFEAARLKTAGLHIPDVRTDFTNGTIQSKAYIDEYISKQDTGRHILEIGCSWGYFLKLLKQRGCKPCGLEINPVRARFVKNKLRIPCYTALGELEQAQKRFHKIFLFYTIQYIPDPFLYIERLLRLLEKNGTILMITPNVNEALLSVWKNERYRDFFFEKMTISYFSALSAKRLLIRINKAHPISYSISTRQGYGLLNHVNWYFTGKPRATGMVGGDRYAEVIARELRSRSGRIHREVASLIQKRDKQYRSIIEKHQLGNQLIIHIRKRK